MRIFTVFGTRPEAIKMCPLVMEFKKRKEIECIVCLTGQHREMLKQVMDTFSIREDYNLDIMENRQTLTSITTSILKEIEPILQVERPDVVLVHGDTTTSYAAALAAFYQQIPVGHVEAGLRTGNMYSPFPEEMNRLLTDRISTYYFAPTETNRRNLQKEGITDNVFVTGNTVIDAFAYTVSEEYHFHNRKLAELLDGKLAVSNGNKTIDNSSDRIILVTAHRRENLGEPLRNICRAIARLAKENRALIFVYPVHLNPTVSETVYRLLGDISNVLLIDPIDVLDMHNLLSRCFMVMTDSGGLQEEAPSFGKPVLVLRTETERPEAVEAGTVRVVGVEERAIYEAAKELLEDSKVYEAMSLAVNPYGDGHASKRIVDVLERLPRK